MRMLVILHPMLVNKKYPDNFVYARIKFYSWQKEILAGQLQDHHGREEPGFFY